MPLDGDILLGFGDYFSGEGEIGIEAITPKPGQAFMPPKGATPKGKKPLAMPKGLMHKVAIKHAKATNNPSPHRLAVGNAATAAAQAVAVSKHVAKNTLQYKNAVAQGMHTPLVKSVVSPTSKIGVTVPAIAKGRVLTPRQKAALLKHQKATILLAKAKKNAAVYAQKAGVAGAKGLAFVKVTVPKFPKTGPIVLNAKTTTKIHGILGYIDDVGVENIPPDVLVGMAVALGIVPLPAPAPAAVPEDPNNPPDPNNPGYLMDGTPDPNAGAASTAPPDPNNPGYLTDGTPDPNYTAGATDSSGLPVNNSTGQNGTGVVTDPDGNVLYDPSTDPEVVPMPVRGQTLSPTDAQAIWSASVPEDGFVYQWNTLPAYAVGSWSVFYSGVNVNHDGYSPGLLWGMDHVGGTLGWMISTDFNVPSRFSQVTHLQGASGTPSTQDIANQAANQLGGGGALVGSPKGPVPNLQYSIADDKWFWQAQYAPVAMTAAADSAITQANATTVATNRAAAVAVAQQMFADRTQQAEQASAQQAQQALAESAATSAANVAASQQQAQQGDVETQAQQSLVDQQNQANQEAAQQAALQQQAGQVLIQQAQQQPPDGGYDDGSGGGYADDGGGYADDGSQDDGSSSDPFDDGSQAPSGQSDDDLLSSDDDSSDDF